MNLAAASGSAMFKKKAPIRVLYGPVGGSFFQKKKVSVGNIKHSGDEKDISLVKPGSSHDVYSDMDSISGDSRDNNISFGVSNGSFLGSAINTLKAKKVNTNLVCGFLLGLIDYGMNKDDELLPSFLKISLEKKWVDPKIVKFQVKVSVRKFFVLDINLSTVERKSVMTKTYFIRKIFLLVNGFGGATTPLNMEITISLAREKEIVVNNDLKKQGICSDWAVVIKKILMNMPKEIITIVEFAELDQANLLVSKWSFLISKDSVHVAKAVEDHETWASKNQFRALLFTLPVGMTAHDLETLLKKTGGKTCVINRSLETGNRICYAVMDLVCCMKYEHFGHSALECDASEVLVLPLSKKLYKKIASEKAHFQLAKLYEKKDVPISHLVAFMVLLTNSSGGAYFKSDSSSLPLDILHLGGTLPSILNNNSGLSGYLAILEQFLELLSDQVFVLLKKLSFMKLVPLTVSPSAPPSVIPISLASVLDLDMVLDNVLVSSIPFSSVGLNLMANFSSSSSKVLTTKVGKLESKMVALVAFINLVLGRLDHLYSGLGFVWKIATCNARGINNPAKQEDIVCWHKDIDNLISIITETKLRDRVHLWITDKFDGVHVFTSGLNSGYLGSDVAIVINSFLAKHVCKVSEVSD
ncbi:hypothetical protein G9A89_015001 [Geosiphon pyriformis]|nr:hypothetical protein G9A89_015001 [Geosiphon pyriformis]